MATELMKDWIVELHNPERRQTTGYLGEQYSDGTQANCCLGVLCEVKGINPVPYGVDEDEDGLNSNRAITLSYEGKTGLAPTHVIEDVLGLDKNPYASGAETLDLYETEQTDWDGFPITATVSANEANDEHGLTFKEIADKLVERYLSGDEAFEVRKRVEDLGWA